jgi:REP element-mobilizing transposase RayT
VTFRLADSLPQEKLAQWRTEKEQWLAQHPEPHDAGTRKQYYDQFPQRLQQWLDAGTGSCVLGLPEVKTILENALKYFDGERYRLDEFAVAPNHVHVLVSPLGEHQLSQILHSWKSFTAHEILKVEAASRRLSETLRQRRDASATLKNKEDGKESGGGVPPPGSRNLTVWQRESFDHIVRSPASMEKFRQYIRNHRKLESGDGVSPLMYLQVTDKQRRDAAATLIKEAVAPLATNPALRQLLIKVHQASEQVIDVITRDRVLFAGASEQTTQNAEEVAKSFRDYIEKHKAEITALQLLYSRPYRHRLTETMLKELEKKLREEHAAWTEDRLWDAFAAVAPKKVKGRSQAGRFADLVALVRFALQREQTLQPFAQTVNQRFQQWLATKQSGSGVPPLISDEQRTRSASAPASEKTQRRDASATITGTFTQEQLAWLELIRDHIATAISIEPNDFNYAPFSQRGGLGKAHQLFGDDLPKLLDELNEVLAA